MRKSASPALARGEVVHARVRPAVHKLRYRVFALLLDVERLDEARNAFFRIGRFGLFSLQPSDHGYRDGRSLAQFAREQAAIASGGNEEIARVDMLFYPRLLGFAFNPLTVYFCRDADGVPRVMIYEVRNTFGGCLTYVVPAGTDADGVVAQRAKKRFYVSPFNDRSGHYLFHVREHADEVTVGVALVDGDGPVLRTHFSGETQPLTAAGLARAFVSYPLMALKVVAAIHWEAAKLWFKGLTLKDVAETDFPNRPIVHGSEALPRDR